MREWDKGGRGQEREGLSGREREGKGKGTKGPTLTCKARDTLKRCAQQISKNESGSDRLKVDLDVEEQKDKWGVTYAQGRGGGASARGQMNGRQHIKQ